MSTARARAEFRWRSRLARQGCRGHGRTSDDCQVVVTHPGATLVEAAKEMARRHVERLPVVDTDNRLVGIISRPTLLTVFLRDDEDIRREVISEVLIRLLWADQNASRSRYATGSSPCPVSSNSADPSRSPCSSPIG